MVVMNEHLLGAFHGDKSGPVLILMAGLHGNESAGITATLQLLDLLCQQKDAIADFTFSGNCYGIAGNIAALKRGIRFVDEDLNRLWTPEHVHMIRQMDLAQRNTEEKALLSILDIFDQIIANHPDQPIVIIDLHTTTADGGIFCIATDDPESIRIASSLHAPVVLGMLEGLQGTTMHYFRRDVLNRDIVTFAFEAGQHDDPLSEIRHVAAILNCLRELEMIIPEQVPFHHDRILIEYANGLPRLTSLISIHRVSPEDDFQLLPGFVNFQPLQKGQLIGTSGGAVLRAPEDCYMLMPRYQKLGNDGYFLLRKMV